MANFDAQVEGLTGLTISSSGTNPTEAQLNQFLLDGEKDVTTKVIEVNPEEKHAFANEQTDSSGAGVAVESGIVLHVGRENGSVTDIRPCTKIPSHYRHLVADTDSIYYRSKYNPGWYWHEGKVYTVPAAAGSDNDSKVVAVYHDSTVDCTANDEFTYFPDRYLHLVILYAGIKSLQNSLSAVDISTFSFSAALPVAPVSPSISSPGVNAITIDSLPTAPTYVGPAVTPDFSDANTWLNTEEDSEMVASRVQVIGAQMQEFQAKMQSALNNYNEENAEYQAGIQRNLQQAQINMQDAQKEADLTLQASIQDYTLELQKHSSDIQKYQADIGKEIQGYQQEIAEKSAEYQWKTARLQDLKQEYNQAFVMMAPPAQPQQQARG